jgi:IclR family pca regulon transcriptional regulator
MTTPADRDQVHSLVRGLDVIRAFAKGAPSMTVSEIAGLSGMNRAAARRFLLTLVRNEYAGSNGKLFWLRPKVLELGFAGLASISLSELAQPVMDSLVGRFGETVFLVVLDGEDVVYVARARSARVFSVDIVVGSRAPAAAMSSGRVLLAGLEDEALAAWLAGTRLVRHTEHTITQKKNLRKEILCVRETGWCLVDQEYEIGLRSASAPVKDSSGQVVAALNVTCPTPRMSVDYIRTELSPELLIAADQISSTVPAAMAQRRESGS